MQNLDRFYTTSDFDRRYLRNETRYRKLERHVISSDSSRVQPNKSGGLWSTNHKVVHHKPGRGSPQKFLGWTFKIGLKIPHKNVKNSARFFNNFRVWSQISQQWIDMSKIGKALINCISSPIWRKTFGEIWSTNNKVIDAHVDPPNWTFFGRLYFGPLGGAGASNFYTR